ncbi:hypothetical protein PYCC9005_002685 [Savitreella phatthalungensis]
MPALRYCGLGYAWIPLVAAIMWGGELIAFLSIWTAQGRPVYEAGGTPPYLSYLGAATHAQRTLFVVGNSITGGFFILSLIVERYLRHKARLDPNIRRRERVLSVLAILFAAGGSGCLIGLAVKNAFQYDTTHWHLTIGFIVCVALSAIFTCSEIGWLNSDYASARWLRASYIVKLLIIILAIVFAIVMGIFYRRDGAYSSGIAAIMEWTIAFLFWLYLVTLIWDLYPAVHSRRNDAWSSTDIEKRHKAHMHRPDHNTVGDRLGEHAGHF